ncbi:MAG: dynamin family protein, partial [Thermococcus sp.]
MVQAPEEVLKTKAFLLKEVCREFGFRKEVEKVEKILSRLENPFLITVFGEVNAGKSSFINALLKIPDLCRTDVDICTDRITVLKYCPSEGRRKLDDLTELDLLGLVLVEVIVGLLLEKVGALVARAILRLDPEGQVTCGAAFSGRRPIGSNVRPHPKE